MKKVVTTKEAAAMLGVTRRWVQILVEKGELEAEYFGSSLAIEVWSVEKYAAAQGRTIEDESGSEESDDLN